MVTFQNIRKTPKLHQHKTNCTSMKLISNKLTIDFMATLLSFMSMFTHADKLGDIKKRAYLLDH